jgi:8-oxo-dGTP diphosphatase
MDASTEEITKQFGNRLRVRVSAIIINEGKILLLNHRNIGPALSLWAPPGGGMDFGKDALTEMKREVKEETGIDVIEAEFLCTHEYLEPPLHAIELFFVATKWTGEAHLGYDPEFPADTTLLKQLKWMSPSELKSIPSIQKHHLLSYIEDHFDLQRFPPYSLYCPKIIQ